MSSYVESVIGAAWLLAAGIAPAEAVIQIKTAEVQNGVTFIMGNGAVLGAQITWESGAVTTANTKNGGFSFFGVLPDDCQGGLSDGSATVSVNVLNCTPDSDGAPAPVAITGQTTCYDSSGEVISCAGTGQDGDIQAGLPFPSPRFTDNANGTVTDNLTRLIWLKNTNCSTISPADWATALSNANSLANEQCGLTDGSVAGDWRLPNIKELQSLIDFGFAFPALSNAAGTAKWTEGDAFSGVLRASYWSSTTHAADEFTAWVVNMWDGNAGNGIRFGATLVTKDDPPPALCGRSGGVNSQVDTLFNFKFNFANFYYPVHSGIA